jgi:hypothetical protein
MDVPWIRPEIIPVESPADATDKLLLLQVPPLIASERVVEEPAQNVVTPVIPDIGFTIILEVVIQPVPKE